MKKDKKKQLPDTPYQVEFLKMAENDERRDCRWCIHRDNKNKWCEELNSKCTGSSQCNFFKKRDENFIPIEKPKKRTIVIINEIEKKYDKECEERARKKYPYGAIVINKNYGKGKIHSITNGIIKVQFEKVGFKEFGVGANEKNDMLELVFVQSKSIIQKNKNK